MPDPSPALAAVDRFRAEVDRNDQQALTRLISAYGRIWEGLQDQIDALTIKIESTNPTPGQLLRMSQYRALERQLITQLNGYASILRNEIGDVIDLMLPMGERHTRELMSQIIAGDNRLATQFQRLSPQTIKTLLGFTSPDSPLYKKVETLPGFTTQWVMDSIVEGVGVGRGPRQIADTIRDAFGRGLTDALRMTRTVQIWTYRESNRASMVANSDILEGWVWKSRLVGACLSCVAQHGTLHPVTEIMNDHHNGRCVPIPVVKGFPPIVTANGKDWFDGLPEAEQRKVMGAGRYEAYRAGKFDFGKLSTEHVDEVYGPMRTEQSLKDLVG